MKLAAAQNAALNILGQHAYQKRAVCVYSVAAAAAHTVYGNAAVFTRGVYNLAPGTHTKGVYSPVIGVSGKLVIRCGKRGVVCKIAV